MTCVVCREHDASTGALCDGCRGDLGGVVVAPQQIRPVIDEPTPASLIDMWGQPHHLELRTEIGRGLEHGLLIFDASVSRVHAEVVREGEHWRVRDLGSSVGTFVNGRRATPELDLADRDRVRFGAVAMYFTLDAPILAARVDAPTQRAARPSEGPPASKLHEVAFELHAPTGGGGGMAVIAGRQFQLTQPQYELLDMLAERMLADEAKPEDQRGFVQVGELLGLSWDAQEPGEDHVRQLVFRIRRTLVKAELGDLIEARRGAGYRLRFLPRIGS